MPSKQAERIAEWEARTGLTRPRIGALFGLATGGSHFVLHKLQGHPQVIALKQRALFPELKHYFGEGSLYVADILERQLRPVKAGLEGLKWIFVNKPQVAFISNQYLFNRENICNIYCFRNPMALYHSRAKDRMHFGQQVYKRKPNWREIAESLLVEYRVSLASFAQAYDPEHDLTLNLESFAARPQDHLDALWKRLAVARMAEADLAVLESCEICGRKLSVKEGQVGRRYEELLYCEHDDLFYSGAGGYNYIRRFKLEGLRSWKDKDHAKELTDFFAEHLGQDLIQFFVDEAYLADGARKQFDELFTSTLAGFRP